MPVTFVPRPIGGVYLRYGVTDNDFSHLYDIDHARLNVGTEPRPYNRVSLHEAGVVLTDYHNTLR